MHSVFFDQLNLGVFLQWKALFSASQINIGRILSLLLTCLWIISRIMRVLWNFLLRLVAVDSLAEILLAAGFLLLLAALPLGLLRFLYLQLDLLWVLDGRGLDLVGQGVVWLALPFGGGLVIPLLLRLQRARILVFVSGVVEVLDFVDLRIIPEKTLVIVFILLRLGTQIFQGAVLVRLLVARPLVLSQLRG